MSINHFSFKSCRLTQSFTGLIFVLCLSHFSYANPDVSVDIPSAQSIAKLIESQSLVEHNNTDKLVDPETIPEAIGQFVETIQQGNETRYLEALTLLEKLADETKNRNAWKIVEIYRQYTNLNDFSVTSSNYDAKREYLESILGRYHWFVDFHIRRLLSFEHMNAQKNDLALQKAQEALALIPNNLSAEAVGARLMALVLNASLQNLMLNKELALINTKQLIDLKLSQGQTVDGIELLNNLMFSP